MEKVWKIGELAKQTGMTVRTLRYYDQIRLLNPSKRTESRYRLYTQDDVTRLHQIVSLRDLGFSLEKIRQFLDESAYSSEQIVTMHLDKVRDQIELQQQLHKRLEAIAQAVQFRQDVSAEELIRIIEVISMVEKHDFNPNFSDEDMEKIKQQGEKFGPDKIREVEQEWPQLIAKVRAEMEKGTPPNDPNVQKLAARWQELVEMFTGGDPDIARKVKEAYDNSPDFSAQMGLDQELLSYVAKVSQA
jgi:DNA-binding transcriptional MerR regulator